MDVPTAAVFLVSFLLCLALATFVALSATKERSFEDVVRLSKSGLTKDKEDKKKSKVSKRAAGPSVAKSEPVSGSNRVREPESDRRQEVAGVKADSVARSDTTATSRRRENQNMRGKDEGTVAASKTESGGGTGQDQGGGSETFSKKKKKPSKVWASAASFVSGDSSAHLPISIKVSTETSERTLHGENEVAVEAKMEPEVQTEKLQLRNAKDSTSNGHKPVTEEVVEHKIISQTLAPKPDVKANEEGSSVASANGGRPKSKAKKGSRIKIDEVGSALPEQKCETVFSPLENQNATQSDQLVEVDEPVIVKQEASLLYAVSSDSEAVPPKTKAKKRPPLTVSAAKPIQVNIPGKKGNRFLHVDEVVNAVKKMAFEDAEVQAIVEILLNKQSGGGNWVEQGQQGHDVKNLQRVLSEREASLEEEVAKVKSLTDRMNVMRRELNVAKSNHVNSQRCVDDMQKRHQHEVQALEARLQQEIDQRHRDVNHLQSQLQYHVQHAQQLQAKVQQSDTSALYPELEQLRQNKLHNEAEVTNLQQQVALQQKELNQLNVQLKQNGSLLEEVEASKKALAKEVEIAKAESENFESKFIELQSSSELWSSKKTQLEGRIEELCLNVKSMESQIADSRSVLQLRDSEISKLRNQMEKLQEMPPPSPTTNGVADQDNGHISGDHEENIRQQVELKWTAKLSEATQEKEKLLSDMTSEIEGLKARIHSLTSDLEGQRSKNNAVQSTEVVRREMEEAQEKFMSRLFPDIKVEAKDHSSWQNSFETKFVEWKDCFSKNQSAADQEAETVEQLKQKLSEYEGVLSNTEKLLHSLQSSAEAEESKWAERLSGKQDALEALKTQVEILTTKNSAMEESLAVVNTVEDMQVKLEELQKKLAGEEAEKKELSESLSLEVEKRAAEKHGLLQEIGELRRVLEQEKKGRGDLGEQMAKMSQLVSTGQDALQQEQKTVELLKDQLAKRGKLDEVPQAQGNGSRSPHENSA